MKSWLRQPLFVLGIVLAWRLLLLIFTAQPIPSNDAYGYDGGVINYLLAGKYCNPSMAVVLPISGTEVYATYPPMYQAVLFGWMKVFGVSVLSAMALHLAMFCVSALLILAIVRKVFPIEGSYALLLLLLFGYTFDDRPDSLAYVFGLGSLLLALRQVSDNTFHPEIAIGLVLTLLLGLLTSVILGAYFFGIGFLACAVAWLWRRKIFWFAPFIVAAGLFFAVVLAIAGFEPRWWAGFMESARQQSVMSGGLRLPDAQGIIRLARTDPVFFVALGMLPAVIRRRKEIFALASPWLALTVAIFIMGWALLVVVITALASNYVTFAIFTQIFLAAGLLALAQRFFPEKERLLRVLLAGCVALVSIRAAGMTTWGMVCAWKNSYANSQQVLRDELRPFAGSAQPVFVSSAYLYTAAETRVKRPIHADWYFDHASWSHDTQFNAITQIQPRKLVLTQFDYYRAFQGILEQLRQQPDLVEIKVRNFTAVPVPDANRTLQRVAQHISWAPVIVDLNWKRPPPG